MNPRRPEPAWMRHCRAELFKLDHGPQYVAVFDLRWRVYSGDCTATQLARHLRQQKLKWAPGERTIQRWLAVILPIETRHLARAEDYQRADSVTRVG